MGPGLEVIVAPCIHSDAAGAVNVLVYRCIGICVGGVRLPPSECDAPGAAACGAHVKLQPIRVRVRVRCRIRLRCRVRCRVKQPVARS